MTNFFRKIIGGGGSAEGREIVTPTDGPTAQEAAERTTYEYQQLEELRSQTGFPFNRPGVLSSLFEVAAQIRPNAELYDLVIGEGRSSDLPLRVVAGLINGARAENELPPATVRSIDGSDPPLTEVSPSLITLPETRYSRALVIAEYMQSGKSLHSVYETTINGIREPYGVDIATVGIETNEVPDWLDPGSLFYSTPNSRGIQYELSKEQARKRIDSTTIGADIAKVTGAFRTMLGIGSSEVQE